MKTNQISRRAARPCPGYRLRVRGRLSFDTILWLELNDQTGDQEETTSLFLSTCDQAALYGALLKFRDLGLTLLAVERLEV